MFNLKCSHFTNLKKKKKTSPDNQTNYSQPHNRIIYLKKAIKIGGKVNFILKNYLKLFLCIFVYVFLILKNSSRLRIRKIDIIFFCSFVLDGANISRCDVTERTMQVLYLKTESNCKNHCFGSIILLGFTVCVSHTDRISHVSNTSHFPKGLRKKKNIVVFWSFCFSLWEVGRIFYMPWFNSRNFGNGNPKSIFVFVVVRCLISVSLDTVNYFGFGIFLGFFVSQSTLLKQPQHCRFEDVRNKKCCKLNNIADEQLIESLVNKKFAIIWITSTSHPLKVQRILFL